MYVFCYKKIKLFMGNRHCICTLCYGTFVWKKIIYSNILNLLREYKFDCLSNHELNKPFCFFVFIKNFGSRSRSTRSPNPTDTFAIIIRLHVALKYLKIFGISGATNAPPPQHMFRSPNDHLQEKDRISHLPHEDSDWNKS